MAMQQQHAIQPYRDQAADELSLARLRVVKDVIASKCNDIELEFFLEVCKHTGLNPFARQIYAIKRGDKLTIQTSIDGYRAIAERSGKYAGQLPPEWCGEDGVWVGIWLKSAPPAAARVGILRSDWKEPVWGIARFAAYQQEMNPLWKKMPDAMLAKCAEALAIRKAFPDALGGVYTREEMEQADHEFAPMVDADPATHHRLPDVTPIRAVEPKPAAAQPAADSGEQVVTMQMCFDHAKAQGIVGQSWTQLKRENGNDPYRIWDAIYDNPEEGIEPHATDEASDPDKDEAIAEFNDFFEDAETAPAETEPTFAASAWNDLRRRMAKLGWTVEEQESFIAQNAVHGAPNEYGPSDWHQINDALQEQEGKAANAEAYDLRKLNTGKGNRGRH